MQFRDLIRLIRRPRRTPQPMPFGRIVRYYQHRVGRLPGHPHDTAAGFAVGVAVSFTPLLGLHVLLGFVLCLLGRFSLVAMVVGTVVGGNPWTLPLIWVVTYKLGHFFLHRYDPDVEAPEDVVSMSIGELLAHPLDVFLPMLVGSLPLALVSGVASYIVVRLALTRYQESRARRCREKQAGGKAEG